MLNHTLKELNDFLRCLIIVDAFGAPKDGTYAVRIIKLRNLPALRVHVVYVFTIT